MQSEGVTSEVKAFLAVVRGEQKSVAEGLQGILPVHPLRKVARILKSHRNGGLDVIVALHKVSRNLFYLKKQEKVEVKTSRNTSAVLYESAQNYFPGGVNSPVRAFRSVGGTPLFIERGKGAHLWDADGNKYLDFCCSWGPLILGHAPEPVLSTIAETMRKGTSFGAPTRLENDLAKTILDNHRYIDKIRFVNSGTEAVMSAVRLARGFTGKDKILKFDGCYHGHVDALLVQAGSGLVTLGNSSSAGVPEHTVEDTVVIPLDDREALAAAMDQYADELAAVIIEPIPANNGLLLQRKDFLDELRRMTAERGVLLIFDEVISGFRVGFEGAAGRYDIQPDIITFGKIIGGGLPVGAYGASHEIMGHVSPEGPVYQAGTLSGNPVAMSAGLAQLRECLRPGFYDELSEKTAQFTAAVNNYAREKGYAMNMVHEASIFWVAFSDSAEIRAAAQIDGQKMNLFSRMHHILLEKGVYLGPSGYEVGFISAAHSESDLAFAAQAFKAALDEIFNA